MRIAIFDPYLRKFTGDIENWWLSHGHEVKMDRYYDPELVLWADVVWFDTVDNNLTSAMNPGNAILGTKFFENTEIPWDMHEMDLTGKKIIVRPIDIEVWQGHHADYKKFDIVTDCIFIASHIRDLMMLDDRPKASSMKIHTIPCGVDLDKWTYKERGPGKKIGIVAERWVSKGVDYAIQLALKMPDYEFHWLGKDNDYNWEAEYLRDMVATKCPNLILEEDFVADLDAWWEDKNYCLSVSKKEAFGYNIAEAMAKGIKPVIHRFYGADDIWPGLTWVSLDEVVEEITNIEKGNYFYYPNDERDWYRQYLIDHGYTVPQQMEKIDAVLNN